MSSDDTLDSFAATARLVGAEGRGIVGVIATAYGCPFEGPVDPARVARMAARLVDAGAEEVILADTIGVAVPSEIRRLHDLLDPVLQGRPWGVHLHNTRNTGYANLAAALDLGASVIDAAIGGRARA